MNRILAIVMIAITAVLIAWGTAPSKEKERTSSPEGTVQAFYNRVKVDDYRGAYELIAPSSNVDFNTLYHDIAGRDGSLKTLSQLRDIEPRVLAHNGNEALVRASLDWATAVGELHESRDLKLVSGDNGNWQIAYSSFLGDIASSTISGLYQPQGISISQTGKNIMLNSASQAVNALLQEFLFKRMTTHTNEPGKSR